MINKIIDSVIRDISAFGSGAFFVFLIILFYLLRMPEISLHLLYGILLTVATIVLMKLIHFKPRPGIKEYKNLLEKIKNGTYPSHHSANIALITIILCFHIPGILMILFLSLTSAGVMASRVYMKKHYLRDTIAGYLLGLIIGLIIL